MSTTIDANAMNPAELAALNGPAAIAEPNALSPETTDLATKLEDPEASKGFMRRNAGKIAATVAGVAAAAAVVWRGRKTAKFLGEVGDAAKAGSGTAQKWRAGTAKFFGLAKEPSAYVKLSTEAGKAAGAAAEAVAPAATKAGETATPVAEAAPKVGLKERAANVWDAIRGR